VTGIYIVPFTNGLGDAIDISSVKSYAKNLPGVAAVWDSADFSLIDPVSIGGKIKEKNINLMVLAGDMPGFAKSFFSSAMAAAGKDPANVKLASFNENGALTARDTEKAKAVVACAVHGIPFETAAVDGDCTVHPDTLVIGGGIAGIQASLEIADSGHKVYLVEKTATIGGHMAMFDKTFPTLDCAACILTPKMVEVGQHTNIDLMTYCEISGISGTPGNYKVSVLKKARRVNLATCIGCGICAEKCPEKVASEFDSATILRKAIYIPFPQAVPNKYLIDAEHCSYVQSNKCGVCAKVCPVVDCINYDEKDEVVEITVGNIIVATGFNVFDAKRIENFGYGKFPNVVTSLEFERLVNAAGPTGGAITTRTQDKKGNWIFLADSPAPKSIALIHCVGSRDENYNKYCSKVCCMYSLKLAHLVTEKLPDAKVYEYYIDMRAFGKGYEEFYERIKGEGVNIIRGRTAKVEEKNKKLLIRSEDIEAGKLIEQEVDMVILAVGLEPRQDAGKIAGMLGISQTRDGWFSEMNYISDPVGTYTAGISIAGLCQGPKDIPDTVAQASAAASRVIQSIINGKMKTYAKDINVSQIEKHVTKVS
ncbi:MAG: CoB--CoM heterodisulfide reductase iron-sulfur subunit A family protein, partial [Bacteroidetes bacterium]|nr:CoB--CoM heterodisulfide reductase iron-sulfur subunit A family protein [Bacteroidota bacterium]